MPRSHRHRWTHDAAAKGRPMSMVDFADAIGLRAAMAHDDERDEVELSPVEAARARLAARGLLQTQPTVVVPKEARPAVDGTGPQEEPRGVETTPKHWAAVPEDTWDVQPGGPDVVVACPQCRHAIRRPLDSTR